MTREVEDLAKVVKIMIYFVIFVLIGWFVKQIVDFISNLKVLPDYVLALIMILAILVIALVLIGHYSKSKRKY